MRLRSSLILCWLALSGCTISVTSFPPSQEPPASPPAAATPTVYSDTPAPPAIIAPQVETPALLEIHFFNELDGWGISETYLMRTNDGGITWYDVRPPDLDEAGSVLETFFLDTDHAWIQRPDFNNFPNNGLLYRTADGGLHWNISSTPFSSGDLRFLDEMNGWMLADLGVGAGSNAVAIFQTRDGGATWQQSYTNDPNLPDAGDSLPLAGLKSDLVPLSMQTAWVGGVIYSPGSPYLYRTGDSGRTWSPVALHLPAGGETFELGIEQDQMQFVSRDDGYLVLRMSGDSTQTVVYVTRDAGETWTPGPVLIPGAGPSVFLSPQEAILFNGEEFYVTRDAARTWVTVSPDIVFGDSFVTMDFVNLNSGWIVTAAEDHHALYRTQDGGATWFPVSP